MDCWILLNQILTSIFGLINVIAAAYLVFETKKLREAETEPELSIYLQPNSQYQNIYDIVVKNIGKGAAHKLKFEIEKDSDLIERKGLRKINELGFFQGANYMAPNQEYKSLFGGQELFREPHPSPLKIQVSYTNKNKKKYLNSFIIDPLNYWGTSYFPPKTIEDISKDLNKISTSIDSIQKYLKKN